MLARAGIFFIRVVSMTAREKQSLLSHLKRGGMFVYPTETAYALGCDATNARAVAAIFRLKGRSASKMLPVIFGSMRMVTRYAQISGLSEKLAKTFWPGPLTIILKSKKQLPRGVTDGEGRIAARVSGHELACEISNLLGKPIVSTSANRSGRPSCYSLSAVRQQFGKKLENVVCIDGGPLHKRNVSTIIRVEGSKLKVIREGILKIKNVRNIFYL